MMRRAVLLISLSLSLCAVPVVALAQEHTISARVPLEENVPSSLELVERADMFDGSVITYHGEVIGEAMVRGNWAWLHVNDDAYMERNIEEGAPLGGLNSGMPVWVPSAEAADVSIFGDYRHQGDIVEVRGVFNAACAEHGGDMDIHAVHVDVVRPGRNVVDPVSRTKFAWAIVASLAAGLAYGLDRNLERLREWYGARSSVR